MPVKEGVPAAAASECRGPLQLRVLRLGSHGTGMSGSASYEQAPSSQQPHARPCADSVVVQFETTFYISSRIILRRGCCMAKQRGYPDQRGLWAESDTIAEQFVPSERYKAQLRAMAETLIAAGLSPEQVASMLFVPVDASSGETPEDQ